MNPRLARLRDEFDRIRYGIDSLEQRAVTESRDLSDDEQSEVDALYTRADTLRS